MGSDALELNDLGIALGLKLHQDSISTAGGADFEIENSQIIGASDLEQF
jgi:hypothetical protein